MEIIVRLGLLFEMIVQLRLDCAIMSRMLSGPMSKQSGLEQLGSALGVKTGFKQDFDSIRVKYSRDWAPNLQFKTLNPKSLNP